MKFFFGKKKSKYHNTFTSVDGIKFHSKKESEFYIVIKNRKESGEIVSFELQQAFPIIYNEKKICTYYADFVTFDKDGNRTVYDVKGFKTQVYKIKKKLVEAFYNINIVEV